MDLLLEPRRRNDRFGNLPFRCFVPEREWCGLPPSATRHLNVRDAYLCGEFLVGLVGNVDPLLNFDDVLWTQLRAQQALAPQDEVEVDVRPQCRILEIGVHSRKW